jgi:hypothetical protein
MGVCLLAGVAALAALYLWPGRELAHRAIVKQEPPAPIRGSAPSMVNSSSVSSIDYKKSFAEAYSYWDYAHKILPAAKMGDADAQFYLSRALERCSNDNKMYFQRRGEALALDQGLQWALQRHLSIDVAQAVYDRCHEFQEHDPGDLGSASDWLARATAAGQPLAQATTALKLFTQQALQNIQATRLVGAAPNPDAPPTIDSQQNPRQLLRMAVESRDPEVLFSIGEAQGYLKSANTEATDPTVNQFAWWLVACERGLDCSANAEWVKVACANDSRCASFTSPSDFVRTLSGDDWDNVEQLAQQISARLDTSQWDELGIGS